MRIGYYVPGTLARHRGIHTRVRATLAAWDRLGHQGRLVTPQAPQRKGPLLAEVLRQDRAAALLCGGLIEQRRIDHLHLRLFLPTPQWLRLDAGVPLSLEVHAGLRRPESARDLARVVIGSFTARRLVRRAGAAVFVTSELSALPEYGSVPCKIAIGNGVEPRPAVPAPQNRRLRVGMALGTVSAWQGLDVFARMADRHRDFEFVAVTPSPLAAQVARQLDGSLARVIPTDGTADYSQALATLDVAVGSLALARAGLREAAPLKVRDYVMAGIPTVLPYWDTNLSGLPDDALLQCADPVTDRRLPEWARAMHGRRVCDDTRLAISIDTVERRRLQALGAI